MRDNLEADYILMNDIRFPAVGTDGFPSTGFEPIGKGEYVAGGFQGTAFSGSLDGNGKTIIDLVIDDVTLNYAGLFGSIQAADKDSVVVKDLIFRDVKITANAIAGALAGQLHTGTVENVQSLRSTEGTETDINTLGSILVGGTLKSYTGGLVGYMDATGSLLSSSSMANISANSLSVGGLVGRNEGIVTGYVIGDVIGDVSGTEYVGGLVGHNIGGTVIGYVIGDVSGTVYVGGLVGQVVGGTVTGYVIGDVSGTEYVGGLTGLNHGTTVGYMRGLVRRKSGTNTVFGLVIGFLVNVNGGLGHHSSSESGFEPHIPTRDVSSYDGDAITVTATSPVASTAFSHLTFGDKIGEWTWTPGRWPAINIGAVQVASEQPTRPSVATLPPAAVTITKGTTSTASALVIDWEAGTLEVSHLTNRGKVLIAAQIKYKVYVVAKTVGSDRTAQQVRDAVITPTEVTAGVTTATIDSVTAATVYEVVVEAINITDNTKKSLSVVVTLNTDA